MILDIGEKLHIIERRYFQEDLRRHFTGEITRCTENTIRLKGYVWVFDNVRGEFIKKPELRERVVPLCERLTINVIPPEVDVAELEYVRTQQKGIVVTDGKEFSLDIIEFTAIR